MTTLFYDVHQTLDHTLRRKRIPGADFDEVTYADDTICISRSISTMNESIKTIEEKGIKYGMKLSKTKCELLTNNPTAKILFPDNSPVKKHISATYLGCELGIRTTNREELSKRFAATMAIMQKIDLLETLGLSNTCKSVHSRRSIKTKTIIWTRVSTTDTISIKKN